MSRTKPATRNQVSKNLVAFTLGHSSHPFSRVLELLHAHDIQCLADVRRFPISRRWPQFNRTSLEAALSQEHIEYHWFPELGGRRSLSTQSELYAGWREEGFRAYAVHMASDEFDRGLHRLLALIADKTVAIMCAEGLWWRCHRRLLSDRLTTHGINIIHILPSGDTATHELTPFAQMVDAKLVYPKNIAPD